MKALDLRFRQQRVRVSENRDRALKVMRGRLVFFQVIACLGFSFMGLRAVDLMVMQAEHTLFPAAESMAESSVRLDAQNDAAAAKTRRANIVDRNGVVLATSLKTDSLYVDPAQIIDKEKTAIELAKIFPEYTADELLDKLNLPRRFVWIKRGVTPKEQEAVLNIGEPALAYTQEDYRFYPQGNLTAHLVGRINREGQGVLGLERGVDDYLNTQSSDKVTDGSVELRTTIDVRVQHILRREVGKAMKDFQGKAGAGVVMDVDTGEVLAAVSLPDFDPNNPPNPNAPEMFNQFSQGVYELGSSFKVFSTAALLEFKKVGMGYRFDAREPIKYGRYKIHDYHAEKRILTVPEVFMVSSNIGSAKMAEQVGTEKIKTFYRDLGLMDAPNFDLKEVSAPLVPNPWREINTLTTAYGHGIAISPLQLVRAAASIVNGGYLVTPRLVVSSPEDIQKSVRVVSEKTSRDMRALMRLAVTEGTGEYADVPGLVVGGKTGTAEKPSKNGRGYDRNRLISSFLAVFPADAPRYVVFVMVDEPKGQKKTFGYATGGWVGAPAVGRVIEAMAPMVGVKRREEHTPAHDIAAPLKRYVHYKEHER
ncbi:MAG: penicillin-binding protein 2 [Alphaproteobacteria bacterium]|nr:penicillin-binding protein 2 [Alphaproteobacteria bacterium]